MARRTFRGWRLHADWQKLDAEGRWYTDPELVVTLIPHSPVDERERYAVVVDLRFDEDGPYVTGIAVRRDKMAGYRGKRTHVAPRAVQRLPLARITQAALAYASTATMPPPIAGSRPFDPRVEASIGYWEVGDHDSKIERGFTVPEPLIAAGEILAPKPRQPLDRSAQFYKWIADQHRRYSSLGVSPRRRSRRSRTSRSTAFTSGSTSHGR